MRIWQQNRINEAKNTASETKKNKNKILCHTETENVSGMSFCGLGKQLAGKIEFVEPVVDACIGLVDKSHW